MYQITNLINEKIYIGIHSTENIDDGYMGSGRRIVEAIKKYGIEHFKKEIIFDFDNPEDMLLKESELVDRGFIARKDVYNVCVGGGVYNSIDNVTVRDKDGKCFNVHKSDHRWISGELKSVARGRVPVKDKDGKTIIVNTDDSRYVSGEFQSCNKGMIRTVNCEGKHFNVYPTDPRFLSGELKNAQIGKIVVKDAFGRCYLMSLDDPRWISGEFVGVWAGKNHTEETKKKIGQANSIHQAGTKNSQYGTCWVVNETESIKIPNTELDLYLKQGWIKGRKMKF